MTIIDEVLGKLKGFLEEMFVTGRVSVAETEAQIASAVNEAVCSLLGAYYEQCNEGIYKDKQGRRAEGLQLVRHGDKRQIETIFGSVSYRRDYYRQRDGQYRYPVDEIAGISPYMRMSNASAKQLVKAAAEMPYAKAAQYTLQSGFSAQTVMNKVRRVSLLAPEAPAVKRRVPYLHIDADEDHVNLHNGRNTIVPIVSVYEGVERNGKRGRCINVFHISCHGKKPDDLWEEVIETIDSRYDLTDTVIYLHGDGAAWIKAGLSWLPNSRFVMDRYHVNNAVKTAIAGLAGQKHGHYQASLKSALYSGNRRAFVSVCSNLQKEIPARSPRALQALAYLLANIGGISILSTDPEAANGGCTEPHVSTILSARLSSRPMAWSVETLSVFPQILAGAHFSMSPQKPLRLPEPCSCVMRCAKTASMRVLGLVDADAATSLPILAGLSSPLSDTLRSITGLA